MAYGVTVIKEQIASQASAVSAGTLDINSNATATSGAGNCLAGQIKPIGSAVSAGTLDLNTNAVLS